MKINRSGIRNVRTISLQEKWRPFRHELGFALRIILFFALLFLASNNNYFAGCQRGYNFAPSCCAAFCARS
jgi:hypothetical protein